MNPEVNITSLGIVLGLVFAGSLGGILWWMLHPPTPIPAVAAKAKWAVGALKKILVPIVESPYSEKGVELACRLGKEQGAEILLTYVLEVPRTLSLDIPLPEAEVKAKGALEDAKSIVSRHELNAITRIERAREVGEGIIRAARDNGADLIVMGIRPSPSAVQDILARTADVLLRRAPCEVIVDKAPD